MKIGMVIKEGDVKKIIAKFFRLEIDGINHFDMKDKSIHLNYDDKE